MAKPGLWQLCMGTVAAGVSSEALDAFFVHIPGTGGSTVTTALQYYACCHGLSRCPITRGVKYHSAVDPYWSQLRDYNVVASHIPGVNVSNAWRNNALRRATKAIVVTILRDPLTYTAKHAHTSQVARLDLQYQYLTQGWRQDPANIPEGTLSLGEATAFLRKNFDVVGLLSYNNPGLFDAFIVRTSLRLTGRPDALLYYPSNVAASCHRPQRPASKRQSRRSLRYRDPAHLWVRPSKNLAQTPTALERRQSSLDFAKVHCPGSPSRWFPRNISCLDIYQALAADTPQVHLDLDNLRIPADVALYFAVGSDYVAQKLPPSWHSQLQTFTKSQQTHRQRHAYLRGTGTSCGIAKLPFGGKCPKSYACMTRDNVMTLRGTAGFGARVTAVNQWFAAAHRSERAPHPPHWVVSGPSMRLQRQPGPTMLGTTKVAYAARLYRNNKSPLDVVVKQGRTRPTSGRNNTCIRYELELEVLYLELLRGSPGVPMLYGGWFDENWGLVYVVQHAGASLGTLIPGHRAQYMINQAYDTAALHRPVELMREIVRCFISFAELGGFFLSDFKPIQFTLNSETLAVYLVDAPRSFHSGLAEFFTASHSAYKGCDAVSVAHIFTMDAVAAGSPTCRESRECLRVWKSRCVDAERRSDGRCSPESRGQCVSGRCVELSTKSHVFEVAANPWLFPRIVALAVNSTLRSDFAALLRLMTRPDPRDRPTFAGVLRILDSLVTA